MQHQINPTEYGPRGQAMADAVQSCVHCGFCLAACPTYAVLGEEMDSPRGRIVLMKHVLEHNLSIAEAQPHIDRCLGCLGCVPACPSGVPYGDLLLSYRGVVEAERSRPLLDAITRRLIIETLPYPSRFRTAVRTGKIGKTVQRALPAQFQGMLNMLPGKLPPARPLPTLFPAQGTRRARVALLAGCVQQVLAPEINWATLHVLAANGVETVIPAGQNCCGAILMHIGELERAQKLAQRNIELFPADVDAVLTNAAGCGSGMHEYGLLFAGTAVADQSAAFAHKVQDVTVFLAELGLQPPPGLAKPMRAVYQDACHLRHAQGVMNAPRQLLTAVPNLTLLELDDGGLCCGSAGTYNLDQPEIAAELGRRKAERIQLTSAEAVISGNIGCITQIQSHLQQPLPVWHTMQLLAQAYVSTGGK
ncbi:MAG: 4Fe-4S dicluster domain-containing protein [Chloroflexi bacterium]|nr:4Fe-4S dicluster domain-containing protein [Ardenticatenaceae bacterium]MBL1130824.1 4Fe-4S dicluster domain-containing protein [Chloroflexota bacterium]NOG36921.1 4Fe-4S dicluster domain-containing protein [Chloroflexota bacterium]